MRNGNKLRLLDERKPMPDFMPSETRIEAKDFDQEMKDNKQFELLIKKIKEDERYRPDFEFAIVKHKTRNVNEYMVQISNPSE